MNGNNKHFITNPNSSIPEKPKNIDEWIAFYHKFWMNSFMKMDLYLAKLQEENTNMEQVITNPNDEMQLAFELTFQAPIELVFDTLTLPEHLKNWYCPNHLNVRSIESKVEVGGEYRIRLVQVKGAGPEMMYFGKYLEINRPNLLIYTQAFSMGEDITPEMKIAIRLKQDGNKTLLNFKQTGFTDKRSLEGARMAWPQIYTKLEKYLDTYGEES